MTSTVPTIKMIERKIPIKRIPPKRAFISAIASVLVIYYKQISEGYEDRERFVILQKVGLDQKQIKQTINKQVLTVFFLPLAFAFLHLAFAYHMLSLILKVVGVVDSAMMLSVTLSNSILN